MIPLSSSEPEGTEEPTAAGEADASTASGEGADAEPEAPVDEPREALAATLREVLGDAVVDHHVEPGADVWVRVERDAWVEAAEAARDRLGCRYFSFLSAIDWLPSPYGRDMDAQEDLVAGTVDAPPAEAPDTAADAALETGYAGGSTRFQLLARLDQPGADLGVLLKADLPDDDLSAPTWRNTFAGADWHEREAWEMFGIDFTGRDDLRHIYLPGAFEGNPLRKDFPLLARRVKPWPGIVDVEPMPDDGSGDDGSGDSDSGDSDSGDGDGDGSSGEGAAS